MKEPRQVAKTAFELARSVFFDTSDASREQKEHLVECGHTINRMCDEIARLTPAPCHDVEQYYPKDMSASEAAFILNDARSIDDGDVVMSIEGRLRQILQQDARLMDDYGESIGRAANAIFRLRRALADAVCELEALSKASDSDYARPDQEMLKWLRDTLEATR